VQPGATAGDHADSTFVIHLDDLRAAPDEEDEPHAPALTPEARALAATWSEPQRERGDGVETWTWQGGGETWELRLTGTLFLSDDDRTVLGSNRPSELRLVRAGPHGETLLRAAGPGDQQVQFAGTVEGRPADADETRRLLAELLPPIVAHTGLAADHRIEVAAAEHGVREALEQVAALTSSTALLDGYETLLRELDEPSPADVGRVLRHAAIHLTDDYAMHELLLEVADLSLDQRGLVSQILEAAATMEDDELLCDVLSSLLDRSDEASDATVARVLRLATTCAGSDAPMATVLQDAAFFGLGSKAARLAWIDALATIGTDGPLDSAIEAVLGGGESPPEVCLAAVLATRRIATESLRSQALSAATLEDLADAQVAGAYVDAVSGLQDASVRAGLLVSLLRQSRNAPDFTSRWLALAHGLPPDESLASVLRAVPDERLADPDVATPYRTLAGSLASEDERARLLARLPATPAR